MCPTRSSTASSSAPTATPSRSSSTTGSRARGVAYHRADGMRLQRAAAVAVAGYSIETPRLLLHSTSPRFPNGIGNQDDQVGRYLMVQGAPQVAGRFPELLGMYKGPPPEICSEQFYETDEARGFARGFAIQTVGPQPIAWAEHVLADGHWGQALREYMRDYNHWFTLGTLCELLPLAGEPRHARRGEGRPRHPGRALRLHAVRQRPREHRLREGDPAPDLGGRRRAGRADDRPLRPPRRRLPDGPLAARQRRRRRPPRVGPVEPVHRRRQRDAHAGLGQPGADDHGARVAARRPPRRTAAWPRSERA